MNLNTVKSLALRYGGQVEIGQDSQRGLSCYIDFPNGYYLSIQGGAGLYSSPRSWAEEYEELELAILVDHEFVMPACLKGQNDQIFPYCGETKVEMICAITSRLPKVSNLTRKYWGARHFLKWRYWHYKWECRDLLDKGKAYFKAMKDAHKRALG